MTKTKHTPAPWLIHEGEDYLEVYSERKGKRDEIVTCCSNSSDTDRANAQLIAAALDLLDALESIMSLADRSGGIEFRGNADQARTAYAAIAKARNAGTVRSTMRMG